MIHEPTPSDECKAVLMCMYAAYKYMYRVRADMAIGYSIAAVFSHHFSLVQTYIYFVS